MVSWELDVIYSKIFNENSVDEWFPCGNPDKQDYQNLTYFRIVDLNGQHQVM